MNNWVLTVLLVISLSHQSQAQPIKSLSHGNKWFYRQSGDGHPIEAYVYTYKLETIADTTVDHHLFTKIERSNINFFNYYLPFPYNQQKLYYFERSDTLSVESIFSAGRYRETLYDFSMEIGDTLFNQAEPPYYYPFFTIQAKGDTTLFGKTLPFIKIKAISYFWGSLGGGEVIITNKFGTIWVHFTGIDYWYKKELQGAVIEGKVFGDTTSSLSWIQNIQIKYDAMGHLLKPELLINFSKPIDPNTLNNSTLFLNSSLSGRHDNLTFNYQPEQQSLSMLSNRGLFAGETITLTFTQAIRTTDPWGVNVPNNMQFTVSSLNGTGVFTPTYSIELPAILSDICCGDFDLDGDIDFIAASDQAIYFLDYEQLTKTYEITKMRESLSKIFPIDMDQDGDLDLAACRNSIYLFLNHSQGSNYQMIKAINYRNIWSLISCDLTSDGYPELITGYRGGEVVIFYGPNYPTSLSYPGNYRILNTSPFEPHSILCGDWNNDGFFDLAINVIDSSKLLIWFNNGQGAFNSPDYFTISNTHYPSNVVTADIDHDGDLDFIFSSGFAIKNNGRGRFNEIVDLHFYGNNVLAGDIDGDDDIDVVGTEDNKSIILLNDGLGNFSRHSEVLLLDKVYKLILVDHDFDGDLDIAAIFYNSKQIQLLNNGSKTFVIDSPSNLNYGYDLKNCYPNPFNSSTVIKYSLAEKSYVSLKVYDINGRLVDETIINNQERGEHEFHWTPQSLTSGVYLIKIQTRNWQKTIKAILLK